jgi:bleomycin hydrolase
MRNFLTSIIFISIIAPFILLSQSDRRDKGVFIEYKNETWDSIKKAVDAFEKKETPKKKSYILDFTTLNIPETVNEFNPLWHNKPVMQSSTGTCWSFASTSFIESEVNRITKKEVKLSEMFTVYYEYIAKVTRFVKEHGNSLVSEGSQTNATLRMMKQYGAVPVSVYNGMLDGQTHHSHSKMVTEINTYLDYCKKNSFWNEDLIISNVKSILNFYMKEPPASFSYEGKNYTPKSFLNEYLKINPDEYVDVMSLLEPGFWKQAVYDVPDNWWKSDVYYNVPVTDFMSALNNAVAKGFSVAIGGDVSEAGMYSYKDAAVIPSFDIPSQYIDDYAKQFRFSNNTTTDDHAIHLVGKTTNASGDWFLIKDSGSGARNGLHKGYYFFHSDFVKLKMTTFMVHKDAVADLLSKFKK